MEKAIKYRHNVITVQSLDAFAGIRGGYHNDLRDVYFLRALGESKNITDDIRCLDERLYEASTRNRLLFHRISEFPQITPYDDLQGYSDSYDACSAHRAIALKTKPENSGFSRVYTDAVYKTMQAYQGVKPNANATILKNFVAKLCFWMDQILTDVVRSWTEQLCVKLVADNVQKEQEYLFLYMTTLIGCDVLILNTHSDAAIKPELRALSGSFTLGGFGNTEIPEWKKPKPEIKPDTPPAAPKICVPQQHTRETASPRVITSAPAQHHQTTTIAQTTAGNTMQSEPQKTKNIDTPERSEKTFEELATLASSIVMITVIDVDADPVSTGSGIMIGRNGYILTNYHVVENGVAFAVRIEDDDHVYLTTEVIKSNPDLDLAVIRINKTLQALPIFNGKTKLVRGQRVVAIGSPLGLFNSVSDGIISGFRRIRNMDMIQFTAPISHGSSGGAVLNMYGEVIGISTAGIDSGQNINLAVGYDDIRIFASGFY